MASSQNGYKRPARALHWLLAILILAMLPIGTVMIREGLDQSLSNILFILHKNGGVIILLLMLVRLAYRMMNPPTPLPASVPDWQQNIAGLSHVLLYFMAFFMAITGYLRVSFGGFPIEGLNALGLHPLLGRDEDLGELFKTLHFYGRYVFIVAIVLHIGAALHHAVILRDGVYRRIWPV